mgnify:CR=1 FL=1
MDLKQLLNQTKIGIDESEQTVEDNEQTEQTNEEVNLSLDEIDALENELVTTETTESSEEEVQKIDPRFAVPWNKLEKGSKMNRILEFVKTQKDEYELNETQTKELKNLLFKGCENSLFNKVSDVKYNQETGFIESFKNLEFNESSKKYKLKTGGTKNRSVSKSRSNIDRLTKKK